MKRPMRGVIPLKTSPQDRAAKRHGALSTLQTNCVQPVRELLFELGKIAVGREAFRIGERRIIT